MNQKLDAFGKIYLISVKRLSPLLFREKYSSFNERIKNFKEEFIMKQEGILKSAAQALAIGFGYIAGIYAGMAAVDKVKEYLDNKKTKDNDSEERESI